MPNSITIQSLEIRPILCKRLPKDFSKAVSLLTRPYIPITDLEYEKILDITETPDTDVVSVGGRLASFGAADMGYALMPLNELGYKYLGLDYPERETPSQNDEPKMGTAVELIYQGKKGDYVVKAEKTGDTGIYDELGVSILNSKTGECIGYLYFLLTEQGEPRVLLTSEGNGDGDPQLTYFPLRSKEKAIEII